jgi:REP element-mobilizing transposase RayT
MFRKNIRLKFYDYKLNGYYFVTICTDYRKPYLNNGKIKEIVVAELALLEKRFLGLKIDYYILMPDHIHLIFVLENSDVKLPKIIQAFKSITTLKAKQALPLQ